jgi:hypothetical protein
MEQAQKTQLDELNWNSVFADNVVKIKTLVLL